MAREIQLLTRDPPHGTSCWPVDDSLDRLEAQMQGPEDSPYEKGTFRLEIAIPARYPFEPPKVRFSTPIFHPNIDGSGRICLDSLKQPPAGSWSPSINFGTLLSQIRLLMATPNPDDGLMPDITELYVRQPEKFRETAAKHTLRHATGRDGGAAGGDAAAQQGGASEEAGGGGGETEAAGGGDDETSLAGGTGKRSRAGGAEAGEAGEAGEEVEEGEKDAKLRKVAPDGA